MKVGNLIPILVLFTTSAFAGGWGEAPQINAECEASSRKVQETHIVETQSGVKLELPISFYLVEIKSLDGVAVNKSVASISQGWSSDSGNILRPVELDVEGSVFELHISIDGPTKYITFGPKGLESKRCRFN